MVLERDFGRKLHPVHRLDRETSGIILFAKNPMAASRIQKNFHRVAKSYVAIVHGRPERRDFAVDMPIGYDPSSPVKKKRAAWPGAPERALTRFRVLFSFGAHTLLKAMPETGRLHQVRVHLRLAGFPILGDKLYGLDENFFTEFIRDGETEELLRKLGFPRSALHSRSLRLYHPADGRIMTLKAPLPGDFRAFIAAGRGPCPSR
jgi:23S rRNA pseudouridine1911/1915/1917 synthase